MTVLLDSPVLAALVIAEHEHHERIGRWLANQSSFAVCPMSEAGLLRFLLRLGESPDTALAVLNAIRQHPKCQFWSDELSHSDLAAEQLGAADDLSRAYLSRLATKHRGSFATIDDII